MIFLLYLAVVIPALLIANKLMKADKRRIDERLEWIRNAEKRWEGKTDDFKGSFQQHSEMDRIVLDLQPDGYVEVDEQEEMEEAEFYSHIIFFSESVI